MLNWRDPANPQSGGAERVTLRTWAALRERGHEVFWFTHAYPGCRRESEIDGVRIVREGGVTTALNAARRWYRTQAGFDLVVDQHHGLPWLAPWWSQTRCVAYIHEVLGPIWRAFYPWPVAAFGRIQERWTHRLYWRVPFWTVSQSTAIKLRRHGVRRVTVLPNGSDTRPLPELDAKPLTQPLRLVVVSRLVANKRIDHVIRVVRILRDRGIESELTVVGWGEQGGNLRRLAVESGLGSAVTLAGSLNEDDKNDRLQNAHLLLHTSIREGWGLNVIEANALGTPAVVYPVDGLVDSTVPGATGDITAEETPASMADAVTALVRDPLRYDRYRRSAWERSRLFSWERILPGTCDWLEEQARGPAAVTPSGEQRPRADLGRRSPGNGDRPSGALCGGGRRPKPVFA